MLLLASPAHSGGVCPLPAGLIIELRLSVLFHWGGQWNYTIIEITVGQQSSRAAALAAIRRTTSIFLPGFLVALQLYTPICLFLFFCLFFVLSTYKLTNQIN